PFVWLLFRRMRLQRELACDRWVLETRCADRGEARAYGETLLKLIQEYTPRTSTPSLVGILEGEQSAKARLRQIAAFQLGGSRNRTAGVFVLLMLAMIGLSNAQTEKIAAPSGEVPEPSQSVNRIEQKTKTAGIQMLEQEYARQKKEMDAARERVDRLRLEYNISSVEESGSNTERDEQISLQQRLKAVAEQHSYDNAMLSHLKTLNRRDLRKALPTALRPPDELLNRYLADLGTAEQKVIALSENFSDEHYEVKNVRNVMQKINEQIESRIDGILAGLEARKVVAENLADSLKAEMRETQVGYAEKQQKFAPFFKAKRDLENAQRILDTIFMRLLAEKVDAQPPGADAPRQR
ncbi:MAG: M56 family metallopeptidase, partial [Limisphaerales bacterium]